MRTQEREGIQSTGVRRGNQKTRQHKSHTDNTFKPQEFFGMRMDYRMFKSQARYQKIMILPIKVFVFSCFISVLT